MEDIVWLDFATLIARLCCFPGLGVRLVGEHRENGEEKEESESERRASAPPRPLPTCIFPLAFPHVNLVLAVPKLIKHLKKASLRTGSRLGSTRAGGKAPLHQTPSRRIASLVDSLFAARA